MSLGLSGAQARPYAYGTLPPRTRTPHHCRIDRPIPSPLITSNGVTPFILLQLAGLAIIFGFERIVMWLPEEAYGP